MSENKRPTKVPQVIRTAYWRARGGAGLRGPYENDLRALYDSVREAIDADAECETKELARRRGGAQWLNS